MKIKSESEFIRAAELARAPGISHYKIIAESARKASNPATAARLIQANAGRKAAITNYLKIYGFGV